MARTKRAPQFGSKRRKNSTSSTVSALVNSWFVRWAVLAPLALYIVWSLACVSVYYRATLFYDAGSAGAKQHLRYAHAMAEEGASDSALAAFVAAGVSQPPSSEALAAAALALAQHAELLVSARARQRAIPCEAKIVGEAPTIPTDNQTRDAIEHARRAIDASHSFEPDMERGQKEKHEREMAVRALVRAIAGTTDEIEQMLDEVRSSPSPPPHLVNKLQTELKKLRGGYGRHDEAIEFLRGAVRDAPRFDIGWFNLASTLESVNRFEEAAHAAEQVVRINPQDYEAYEKLGLACRDHGEHGYCAGGKAADALRKAEAGGRKQQYLGRMLYRRALHAKQVQWEEHGGVTKAGRRSRVLERAEKDLRDALHTYTVRHKHERGYFTVPRVLLALGDAASLREADRLLQEWCDSLPAESSATAPALEALTLSDEDAAESDAAAPASEDELVAFYAKSEVRHAWATCRGLRAEVQAQQRVVDAASGDADAAAPWVDNTYVQYFRPAPLGRLMRSARQAVLGDARTVPSTEQARDIALNFSNSAKRLLYTPLTASERDRGELNARSAARALRTFDEYGVMAFESVVPEAALAQLRRFVNEQAFHRTGMGVAASIKNPSRRFYPLLTLQEAQPVLAHAVKLLHPLLRAIVGGDAALCELGVIVADPGGVGQNEHVDTSPRWDMLGDRTVPGVLVSVFVTLADVHFDAGAFEAWPGSQRNYFNVDSTLTRHAAGDGVRFAAPAGTVYAYNSALVHRGRANEHHQRRANFMFSVVRRETNSAEQRFTMPHGSTWALLKQYGTRQSGFSKSLDDLH